MPGKNLHTFVGLIRGVNVGGHRPLPMGRLREVVSSLGHSAVRTYLQSGNVVFRSGKRDADKHALDLHKALLEVAGLDVPVMVLAAVDLRRAFTSNPFLKRPGADPGHLHAAFASGGLPRDGFGAEPLPLLPGEEVAIASGVAYLLCPRGYGQSKLTNSVLERRLGVPVTVRNWRTVGELDRMASECP